MYYDRLEEVCVENEILRKRNETLRKSNEDLNKLVDKLMQVCEVIISLGDE